MYVFLILLIVTNAAMLFLNFFAMPGNWLMIGVTALFAWWRTDTSIFSVYTLVAVVVLAIAGEIVEFLAGPGGARKAGSTFRGAFGAIVGMMAGAIAGGRYALEVWIDPGQHHAAGAIAATAEGAKAGAAGAAARRVAANIVDAIGSGALQR